jgi:2,5-diketo-D-gluconate reductase A
MSTTTPTLTLQNNAAIPVLGLGTSPMLGEEATAAVRSALEAGYRLLDTAENYRNEEAVGRGIAESGVERDEIFLTTKFNRQWHSADGVAEAFRGSTERLGVEYLDMLMVHWPNPDQDGYVGAVDGLGRLLADGRIRAIGVSNFKPAHLQRVFDETGLVPDVNQIQLSPYTSRAASRAYHGEHGIVTESWSPLGASSGELRNDPLVSKIAEGHGKSTTQVVLRWHLQLGLVAIPRSSNPGRIAENIDIFDFELDESEMERIADLDRGEAEATDSDVVGH